MSLGHYEHLGTYRNILGTLRKSIEVICIKTKFNLKKKIKHNNGNSCNLHIYTKEVSRYVYINQVSTYDSCFFF